MVATGAIIVGDPTYSADYISALRLGMKPGDSKTITSFSFGYPSWQVMSSAVTYARAADTTLPRPGAGEAAARLYTSEMKTPMGAFKAQVWTDERPVVLKTVTVMPFGTISAELK